MTAEFREVRLPEDLCAAAELQYGSQFGSLDELVTFVLQEVLRDDSARLNAAEERVIEQRLRDLGYV